MRVRGLEVRCRLNRSGFTLDVDLQLPGRGVSALFGASGSGKTTLLRCIAGLEPAVQGRLCVDGEVWQDDHHWLPPHRRPMGYVFQEASLFAHLTVMGNLRYGLKRTPSSSHAHRPVMNLEQAIELLGIGHLLERKPEQLSGGERQRVGIARALAVNPRVLLMDEPLAALDVQRKRDILPYLERLHDELDIPVLYVSHSPDEVARLADHLVVLNAGQVVAHGPLQATLTRLDLPMPLGEDAGAMLEATVACFDTPWHLMRVDFAGGSLWTRANPQLNIGHPVRVRVLARDVSLAEHPGTSSIQNLLPGRVDAMGDDDHPGLALVRVKVGEVFLLSRLTKRAAAALGVTPGKQLWVQVKSVALLE